MKFKRIIKRIFLPERCSICGEIKPFMLPYCEKCGIDAKPISSSACPDCGHEKCMCSDGANINLRHFTAVYYYQGQLKKSLLSFKFYNEKGYADIFGKAMAKRINELYGDISFDGICFVPMTYGNLIKRGYNQSELLAVKMSDELGIPVVPCLKKTRDSLHQKDLNALQRTENVKNSFGFFGKSDICEKTLILCDDIKTTGATLRECSDTLMKAGAKDVYSIALAITPYLDYTDPF